MICRPMSSGFLVPPTGASGCILGEAWLDNLELQIILTMCKTFRLNSCIVEIFSVKDGYYQVEVSYAYLQKGNGMKISMDLMNPTGYPLRDAITLEVILPIVENKLPQWYFVEKRIYITKAMIT